MNEAALRGIDLTALKRELPTHPTQVKNRAGNDEQAALYWALKRHRMRHLEPLEAEAKPIRRGKKEPHFTDRQIEIAIRALEGKHDYTS